ncbi:hypothetical protein [Marinicella sp. W31]|uniref:FG-GAP repeat protein n=1 Tax=Marinicella sp. W31 TaxID=3023713 RepID=UPI0037579EDD
MIKYKSIIALFMLLLPILGLTGTITELQKLQNMGQMIDNNFGRSVSIDENRAAIGASSENMFEGAVYLFNETSNGWVQTHRLVASDAQPSFFGRDISLQGDRLLVGSVFADSPTVTDSGAVYVFEYDGTDWIETAKLLPNDPITNGFFGTSVSLDGDRIVVGANLSSNLAGGSVYVFEFNGNSWTQTQNLSPSISVTNDFFGKNISLKGNQLLVSEEFDSNNNISTGAVYMFNYNGNTWQETQKIIAPDSNDQQRFGFSLDLGQDYFVVGAIGDNTQGFNTGAAYVYTLGSNNTWLLDQKLLKTNAAPSDLFGFDVGINDNSVVVSAIPSVINSGTAYLYKQFGISWREIFTLSATDQSNNDEFGLRLSISKNRILIGAASSGNAGAAYVFNNDLIFINGFEALN